MRAQCLQCAQDMCGMVEVKYLSFSSIIISEFVEERSNTQKTYLHILATAMARDIASQMYICTAHTALPRLLTRVSQAQ